MKIISLDKLKINEKGIIDNINSKLELKRRLEDLGMTKGTIIKCELESPFKDPKAYLVKGCIIAIRDEDAKKIMVIIDE